MEEKHQEDFGLCKDLFVSSRPDDQTIVIGGVYQKDNASENWNRILNKRAAHLLWFRLTSALFPEKAQQVTALVSTAPLSAMTLSPIITTHTDVVLSANEFYEIKGVMGKTTWTARMNSLEARRLWTSLDLALYPNGWEGNSQSQTGSSEVKMMRRRQTYQ